MRRYQWLTFCLCLSLLSLTATAARAQSYRLNSLAEQLATQSADLAERAYSDYRNSSFSNRNDVEAVYLAQQFSASAELFRRMVRDGRREPELKDAAAVLSDILGRADRGFGRRSQWGDVRRTLDDIMRELNLGPGRGGGGGRDDDNNGGGRQTGRARWRGTVDDNINLVIRDDRIEVRTIGGSPYGEGSYNFTSPLPRRRVTVNATRITGRGDVRVIQQPSRDNDYTAVVEIRDPKGGAREYEIEVNW